MTSIQTNHAWSEAYVDNRWVIIDTTWDSNNLYNEKGKFQTKPSSDKYFDIAIKDISITHKYINYNIAKIDTLSGFNNSESITTVSIPNTVTTIGGWAFQNCTNLAIVSMADTVTSIGSCAFSDDASLKSINISDKVVSIEDLTFYNCTSLEEVILSDNLINIGNSAFANCESIKSITIPNGTIKIADWAFANCKSLEEVIISESIIDIGQLTFAGCPKLTIYGTAGSYAEKYAKDNKIKFALISSLKHSDVLNTNITVSINGNKIPSYHIGSMAVNVEDLSKYGFIVDYQSATKAYSVTGFDKNKKVTPLILEKNTGTPGSKKGECFRTDKRVYINGKSVNCYEYDGKIIILVSDLNAFVNSVWDGTKSETVLTTK